MNLSQPINGEFVQYFQNLSIELGIGIGVSYLRRDSENNYIVAPYNSITLIDKKGNIVYTYDKIHTVVFNECEDLTSAGYRYQMEYFNLYDERGSILVSSFICYDQEFPETARILGNVKGLFYALISNHLFILYNG